MHVATFAFALTVHAQQSAARGAQTRTVAGSVRVARHDAPIPAAGLWVVVHRISTDAKGTISGGPLDSAKTSGSGKYEIHYPFSGDSSTYIAVVTYRGISYISSPLRAPSVTGDDATITVFDTTSPPYPIRVAGRHFVITNPDADGRRRVIEVYELSNDSTLTVVGSASNPVFRAALPAGAKDFQLNPMGDIADATVKQVGETVNVFTPISPGLRQLSFTYTLPSDAFPLSVAMLDSGQVMEVLVQEQGAIVDGAGLSEVAPVTQEGQTYRRFLAQVPQRSAVITFAMPARTSGLVRNAVPIVAATVGGLLLLALGFAGVRRRQRIRSAPRATVDPVEALVRELAAFDTQAEHSAREGVAPATTVAQRTAIKARLAAALAARDGAS